MNAMKRTMLERHASVNNYFDQLPWKQATGRWTMWGTRKVGDEYFTKALGNCLLALTLDFQEHADGTS